MPAKTKASLRQTNGAATTAISKKHSKKAAKPAQIAEQLEQELRATHVEEAGLTGDEAIPTTQEDLAHRMNYMMTMLLDLSWKVHASETQL